MSAIPIPKTISLKTSDSMYDITIKYNKKEKFYWASMSKNGKSAVMIFFDDGHLPFSYSDPTEVHVFYAGFGVGTSRKQVMDWLIGDSNFIDSKITGNGSVSYLYFARDALRAFTRYIRVHLPPDRYVIIVQGADKRRFRIYRKYLEKHGYVYGTTDPTNMRECMVGKINTLDPDKY